VRTIAACLLFSVAGPAVGVAQDQPADSAEERAVAAIRKVAARVDRGKDGKDP